MHIKENKNTLQGYQQILADAQKQLNELKSKYTALEHTRSLQSPHDDMRDVKIHEIEDNYQKKQSIVEATYRQHIEKASIQRDQQRQQIEVSVKNQRLEIKRKSQDLSIESGQVQDQGQLALLTTQRTEFKRRFGELLEYIERIENPLPDLSSISSTIRPNNVRIYLQGKSVLDKLSHFEKCIDEVAKESEQLIGSPFIIKMLTYVQQCALLCSIAGIAYGAWLFTKHSHDALVPGIAAAMWLVFALWLMIARAHSLKKRAQRIVDMHATFRAYRSEMNKLQQVAEKILNPNSIIEATIDTLLNQQNSEELHIERQQQYVKRETSTVQIESERQLLKLDQAIDAQRQTLQTQYESSTSELQHYKQREIQDFVAASESQQEKLLHGIQQQQADIIYQRDVLFSHLREQCHHSWQQSRQEYHSWSDAYWNNWQSLRSPQNAQGTLGHVLPLGTLHTSTGALLNNCNWNEQAGKVEDNVESSDIIFPIDLLLPQASLLLCRMQAAAGMKIIHQMMLRMLTHFPAGLARFTLYDARGLGDRFAQFLRLADVDEHLIDDKVWTTYTEIEESLAGLSAHAEKIVQKYLRNQHQTLDAYNCAAGDLAEPYQVVVIADFPTGFSSLAIERLNALLEYGPRCGIIVWMQHDPQQHMPKELDLKKFTSNGIVCEENRDDSSEDAKIVLAEFPDCELRAEPLPQVQVSECILDTVGAASASAANRTVSMKAGAPPTEKIWSSDSASILRIPIGRSGSERLQYFELGKGTAQHVLIGGRTGSGKSTLLHTLITCGAMWYRPDQLQFYLIDFKKGVEFKKYATHNLPHARVIAVESDREYALSTLQTIDAELERRGELFRQAEVQDLAGYRKAQPDAFMPRSLLIIDEFHEFFTEDDLIARDASLYLERFVRQGRAFGLHLVLGSQSIAGSMSVNRSTIGQMGVRIALQCNEADSQLILGEENAAARLLERPGEAIYNARSGQVEGNNPFQVFFSNEEEQLSYLRTLNDRIEQQRPENIPQTWVFEGNVPAQLSDNMQLQELLQMTTGDRNSQNDQNDKDGHNIQRLHCWLGEPNAIKGPTELCFESRQGSNLLVAGHNRESVYGMVQSATLSFSARYPDNSLRIIIVDGDDVDHRLHKRLRECVSALPQQVEWLEGAAGIARIAELGARCADEMQDVEVQETGSKHSEATIVFVLGMGRLRALRHVEDFSFASANAEKSAGQQFAELLENGPEKGIHSFVWCESATVVNNSFQRATLRHFEKRLLFQMSSGDSSELVDSSIASHLGLHHAVLCDLETLHNEKFRPYCFGGSLFRGTSSLALPAD